MSLLKTIVLACGIVAAACVPAWADGFITPFLGYNFGGDSANCAHLTDCQEKHANFGVSIGTIGGVFGFEEDIAYAKDFFAAIPGIDNNVFTLMSNLTISVPAGPVQPYVLGGIGLIRSHVSVKNPASINPINKENALGYDLGGGVNVFFARRVGVRGDIRHFHTLQDVGVNQLFTGDKLEYWRASAGLTLKF